MRSRGIHIVNQGVGRRAAQTPEQSTPVEGNAVNPEPAETSVQDAATEQEALDAAVAEELTAVFENERPKRKSRATAPKKRKKGEEDEAYDPENEPDYGRSGFSRKNRPAAGQIEFCAKCNCRFTVTIYNKTDDTGALLCSACGSVGDGVKVPSRSKVAPAVKKKRAKAILDGDTDPVPKLQDISIRCIAKHIEAVEVLGDIGHINMDKICQIISRNRSLTNDTVQLFLDSSLKSLSLYDCAKIGRDRLIQVAQMCPHLTELKLHMVGQIDDTVLDFYGKHLQNLTSLALRGCFLITVKAWSKLCEVIGPRLELLEISDTSRFNEDTAQQLVQHCPNLKSLTLRKITHLNDAAIAHFADLKHLTKLDISHAGGQISDATIISLITNIGSTLEVLDISALRELTDAVLVDGVGKYCSKLNSLSVNDLDLLTDDGVAQFFNNWTVNSPLIFFAIERCPLVHKEALGAILKHSGSTLRFLNLNSMDELTHEGILQITAPGALPLCETLDISWIRAVDDVVLNRLFENARGLTKLLIWGNNRCTELVVSEKCLIVGKETI